MHANNINNCQNIPSFRKFIKIKGSTAEIANFREELKSNHDAFISIAKHKNNDKNILYIFSGKHLDKFLDLMKEVYFRDLRTNPQEYLKTKPKELSLKQAKKLNKIV